MPPFSRNSNENLMSPKEDALFWEVMMGARGQQKAHNKVRIGETPRRLILKRCRCSSSEKLEDAFDTALDLIQTKP